MHSWSVSFQLFCLLMLKVVKPCLSKLWFPPRQWKGSYLYWCCSFWLCICISVSGQMDISKLVCPSLTFYMLFLRWVLAAARYIKAASLLYLFGFAGHGIVLSVDTDTEFLKLLCNFYKKANTGGVASPLSFCLSSIFCQQQVMYHPVSAERYQVLLIQRRWWLLSAPVGRHMV